MTPPTTLNLTREAVCAGGNHLDIGVAIDGGAMAIAHVNAVELVAPLAEDDLNQLATLLLRIKVAGLDEAAAEAVLANGLTVTL